MLLSQFEDQKNSQFGLDPPLSMVNLVSSLKKLIAWMQNSVMMDLDSWWWNPTLWLVYMIAKVLKRLGLLKYPTLLLLSCPPVELICKHFKNLQHRKRRMWHYGKQRPAILFINTPKRTWQKWLGTYSRMMKTREFILPSLALAPYFNLS